MQKVGGKDKLKKGINRESSDVMNTFKILCGDTVDTNVRGCRLGKNKLKLFL